MDIKEAYAQSADRARQLIAGTGADQLDSESPCKDWSARDLVNHLIGGQFLFSGAAAGQPMSDMSAGAPDFTADDPVAAHRAGSDASMSAFSSPMLADNMAELPFGTIPAAMVPGLACFEQVIHGWDLARATGQDPAMPVEAVEALLPFAEQFLANVPRDGHAFGPIVAVPDDAPAIDRLLGLTGRTP